MKNIKKILVIVVSVSLIFSFLEGAKKKKKNINKYIFSAGMSSGEDKAMLVVFDGETKTVQRKRFGTNSIQDIYYFPKHKKIVLLADNMLSLYSINVDNLNDYYKVDLSQFNKYGRFDYIFALTKKDNNRVLFRYGEARPPSPRWGIPEVLNPTVTNLTDYLLNVKNNKITKPVYDQQWQNIPEDPYEAMPGFTMKKLTDSYLDGAKKYYESISKSTTVKWKKKARKFGKREWKYGKKFLKLLKKGKIDVGAYNQPSDLYFKPTGGRYMVVRNDKLYLVHMKTKKVYTLMDNPFRDLNYFIIEKNEDDLDLDKE